MKQRWALTYELAVEAARDVEDLTLAWAGRRAVSTEGLTESTVWKFGEQARWRIQRVRNTNLNVMRVELVSPASGPEMRRTTVWLESNDEHVAVTVHESDAFDAAEATEDSTVEAFARELVSRFSVKIAEHSIGELRQVRVESVPRLLKWLNSPNRRVPAVLTHDREYARTLHEGVGWLAQVIEFAPEAIGPFNEMVEGYYRLPTNAEGTAFHVFALGKPGNRDEYQRNLFNQRSVQHVRRFCAERLVVHAARPAADRRVEDALLEQRANAALASLRAQFEQQPGTNDDDTNELFNILEQSHAEEKERRLTLEGELAVTQGELKALKAQLARWKCVETPQPPAQVDPWAFDALELSVAGALVFTDNARSVWRKNGHPHEGLLWTTLVDLALAAANYRSADRQVGTALPEWLKERLGKECPFQDEGLAKRKLDTFKHAGATLSRLPHVKVKDNCPFNQVARIYFAVDPEGHFVVDHVGGKLYDAA